MLVLRGVQDRVQQQTQRANAQQTGSARTIYQLRDHGKLPMSLRLSIFVLRVGMTESTTHSH